MDKKKTSKQYKTETIAQTGGLQTDNRMYFDPIYESNMYGNFFRSLYSSKGNTKAKIFFSLFVLIIPMLISDIFVTQQTFFGEKNIVSTSLDMPGMLFYFYPFSILIYFIAGKLLLKAIKDKKDNSSKKKMIKT